MSTAFVNRKCLVLNKFSTAVGVVSLPRAIIMLFSEVDGAPKAEIIGGAPEFQPYTWEEWAAIEPKEGEDVIRGCRGVFRIPEVIKLSKYDQIPEQKIHFSRRTIYRRDHNTCLYCGKKCATEDLTIDHIIPKSCGGLTSWENCCLACVACNSAKADLMPNRVMLPEVITDKQGKQKTKMVPGFVVFFLDQKKKWKVTIRQPKKPKYNFFKGDIRYESWKQWVDVAYWNVELANDNR
jgi:5-methylcytosine-specific restriction endonuclease McrA